MHVCSFQDAKSDKESEKLFSETEQRELEDFEKKQLTSNPYHGKPLGYPFFREKKIGGKRAYFLVYDEL